MKSGKEAYHGRYMFAVGGGGDGGSIVVALGDWRWQPEAGQVNFVHELYALCELEIPPCAESENLV